MSYTELEHGYQGLRKARPAFYFGDEGTVRFFKGRGNLTELGDDDSYGEDGKQVVVGVCAMAKKSQSKPMKEILTRLQEFEYIKMIVFAEEDILKKPVEEWPTCDCLISFHSKGFPLDKAIQYATLRKPFIINNLHMQYDIQDRRKVYSILESEGIEIPRYAVLDRDSPDPKHHELIESEDHVEVNGIVFNKPFVEKPVSAEDHNIYIYYPTSAGGGSQRLFRKIGSRSSVYSPESRVRKTGSFIYEDFMPTDGTDVKVYTVGPDYAHAEARKSPALDGKVERDSEGKEVRYPVILSNAEKLISRKVCLAFKQTVCGFDLLRANGKSFVCDVNGFSFVKNSNKYYDDCAKILGNMILRELAPTLHIPWSVPFQLDDPPIVPTTFGKMMELRCVVAVIRHGDRTPKQKMKVEVRHPKFFEIFEKYGGRADGHVKLKRPKQLQEILDIARSLLNEIEHRAADPEIEEKQGKLEQLKSVLEMYGHFSGINRKVQMKYQPKGRPRGSSSDDDTPKEPSLVLILKWGGELTPAGRIQAEELGKIFRCMYPGGQGRHAGGEYAGKQGLGLLRLHSTFRHDLKIYASDEGRVQMTAAAFAKGLLALEGELTPILVQMVKSANTNGLLDNDCDASKHQNMAKAQLHHLMQQNRDFTAEDRSSINPCNAISISMAMDFVKNPVKCCERVQDLIQKLMNIVRTKKDDQKTKDAVLYHGETWELMGRRWGKIEKDFCTKNKTYDISKIPDIYDCIKYDLQHNQHTLQFDQAEELYINAKHLADIVIPQEYGLTVQEKLTISQGICTPLLKKIRADLQRNIEETGEETVNRLNPRYSHGVSSPGRHVRTRLYFTSESHVHSLLTVLRYGGLIDNMKDEQWRRAMEYVSMVSELNYMSQIVVMLYEDPTKDPSSDERFHVELHFSPGVNCCVQKNLPPGPGFRPHSRNEQSQSQSTSQSVTGSDVEDSSTPQTPARCDSPGTEGSSPTVEKKTVTISTRPKIKTSAPIPINVAGGDVAHSSGDASTKGQLTASARLHDDIEVDDYDEHAKRVGSRGLSLSFSSSAKAQISNLPETEPRSRSFDHSREPHPKGIQAEIGESLSEEEEMSIIKKQKKYKENLLVFNSRISGDSTFNKSNRKNDIESVISKPNKFAAARFKHLNIFGNRSRSVDLSSGQSDPCKDKMELASTLFSKLKKRERKGFFTNKKQLEMKMSSATGIDLQALDLAHVEVFTHKEKKIVSDQMKKNISFPQIESKNDGEKNLGAIRKHKFADKNALQNECEDKFLSKESPSQFKRYVKKKSSHSCRNIEHKKSPNTLLESISGNDYFDMWSASCCSNNQGWGECGDRISPSEYVSDSSKPLIILTQSKSDQSEGAKNSPDSPMGPERAKDSPQNKIRKPTFERRTQSVSHCLGVTHLSPPDPGLSRRHRHSISGQMSYFHATCGGHIAHARGSSNSLFSTAVISGSSSAPNLRDMIPNTAAVAAALEGCGGVPLIRPLETLHNALSLRQLDMFLDKMSRALLYRTPLSSPPKHPSTPLPQSVQSPNNSVGWSGPPSFVSSSGPSSPNGLSDFFRGGIGTSDSSDFSASIISNDGFKFGAGPCDSMINTFGGDTHMTDSMTAYTHRDSIEVAELYNTQQALESMQFYPIKADGGDNSGDLTPVSLGSEVDPYDFTAAAPPSHIDNLDEFDIPTCEDEDEEMTLTAFTKEEMSRPRLAEIKWIQDDAPILPQPQKQALGRFECVGAVCDVYESAGAAFEQPANLDQIDKQYITSKIQEGVFEMNLDAGGETNGNTNQTEERRMSNSSQNGDRRMSNASQMSNSSQNEDRRMSNEELQSCFHFGLHHNFECERGGVSISPATSSTDHLHHPNAPNAPNAPVLTLASSLNDESCISRGFVLPRQDSGGMPTSNNE